MYKKIGYIAVFFIRYHCSLSLQPLNYYSHESRASYIQFGAGIWKFESQFFMEPTTVRGLANFQGVISL